MQLLPSHDAVSLITVLPEQLQSPLLTAEWEYRLGEIERGQLAPEEFLVLFFIGSSYCSGNLYAKFPYSTIILSLNYPLAYPIIFRQFSILHFLNVNYVQVLLPMVKSVSLK